METYLPTPESKGVKYELISHLFPLSLLFHQLYLLPHRRNNYSCTVHAADVACTFLARNSSQANTIKVFSIEFFNVDFDRILQDDVDFSRHVLILLTAFISAILFTAAIASVQWILLPDLEEGIMSALQMVRLVLGLVICFLFSRRLPRQSFAI